MRKLVSCMTSTCLLTGCLTTNYVQRDHNGTDVRFGGRLPDETLVRHVVKEAHRSHFLLGAVPYEADVDVAELAELEPGQTLVNTRLEASMTGIDVVLWLGIGIISYGLGFLVWTPRTTTLTGDVVESKGKAAPAGDKAATAAKAPAAPGKAAAPEVGSLFVLDGTYSQAAATTACEGQGARLAHKGELEGAYKTGQLDKKAGDVWTDDRNGQDGWSYNTESGAAFLKDPSEPLGAVCFKKGN